LNGRPDFIVPNERGGLFTKDQDFFTSISVPPDGTSGLEAEEKARAQYEAHQWQKKVVVGDVTWHPVKGAAGKGHGLLHGQPKKMAIKALYRAKRPLISVMPTTIFPKDEDGSEFDFLKFLRPAEPEKWVAANALTGEPEDFLLHWASDDTELAAGTRGTPKHPDVEVKPLTDAELRSALFRREPQLAPQIIPRLVTKAEFFAE
jgi:hypothetical protein